MKAIIYEKYGSPDVLRLGEVAKPVPGQGQVLIKVQAAAVNPYDWHFMRGEPYFMRMMVGLRAPKRNQLGLDFAGQVEAVGSGVTEFQPSDEVYGMADGAFAEYVLCAEKQLARKPASLSFEEAAAVPLAAVTALQGLRNVGEIQPGQRVLIVGASGGVGTFAVQLAKHFGAHVTGVCSTRNLEMVRSLGADEVIDYTQTDFTQTGQTYDLVFTLGGMDSPARCRRALTPTGRLVMCSGDSNGRVIGPLGRMISAAILDRFVDQPLLSLNVRRSKADLEELADLIDAGKLTVTIERTYPLSATPAAIAHVEKGHTRGKVVLTL